MCNSKGQIWFVNAGQKQSESLRILGATIIVEESIQLGNRTLQFLRVYILCFSFAFSITVLLTLDTEGAKRTIQQPTAIQKAFNHIESRIHRTPRATDQWLE